eukprot:1144908-Pelagomonas_calceolata.AAC.6
MHHQVANDVNTSSREHGPHGSGLVHTPLARLGGGTPPPPVLQTGLPPLYFQHDGHSRTIIGIERTRKPPAQQLQQPPHHQQQAARKRTAPEPPSLDGNKGSGMGMEGSMSSLILRGGPATFDASRYTYTLLSWQKLFPDPGGNVSNQWGVVWKSLSNVRNEALERSEEALKRLC